MSVVCYIIRYKIILLFLSFTLSNMLLNCSLIFQLHIYYVYKTKIKIENQDYL